ncbi:TPA: hypothetical protein ACJG4C_000279 [Salmonella enterica subsp. diarizonae serovar 61:r:z53]
MTETTYPLDVAAEMLECQQKKIFTEWAKNTISIVIDFGEGERNILARMSIDAKTQPDKNEFFNSVSINDLAYTYIYGKLTEEQKQRNGRIFDENARDVFRQYGYSRFKIDSRDREHAEIKNSKSGSETIEIEAIIFGLWKVNYNDFSRQQVQDYFTLTPYPNGVISGEIKATLKSNCAEPFKLVKKNLRITASDMEKMRKLLSVRANKQIPPPASIAAEQQKQHGGVERFALEREKILAAALYVAHHHPKEIGKSFKSHAEAVEKHSYIFWKNEPAPDAGRIAKMISDAARPPEEWKILGGNAKAKK